MLSPGLPTATPTHTTTDCQKKDSLDLNNPSNLPPPQIREQIYQNARQKKPCHDLLPSVQILAKTRRHALTMHSSFSSHTLNRVKIVTVFITNNQTDIYISSRANSSNRDVREHIQIPNFIYNIDIRT